MDWSQETGSRRARTRRGGHQTRKEGEMKGGRKAGPQTSHLPPLLPRGLQGMGTSLVSTQTPSLHALTSPSTGLGPALPGWDPSSPTRFPHSVTPLMSLFRVFVSFILSVPLSLSLCTSTTPNKHTDEDDPHSVSSVDIIHVYLCYVSIQGTQNL